ncbi:MAG: Rid family hydrolase [Bacteroidota bacterium]
MKKLIFTLPFILLLVSCSQSNKNSETISKAEFIQAEGLSQLNLPFSLAVKYENTIYLSGQIGFVAETGKLIEGGIIPETKQTMENIKMILEQNGSSMENVIKCTCILADYSERNQMNSEYIKFFPNHKPARIAFAAKEIALGARIEIECIAYID